MAVVNFLLGLPGISADGGFTPTPPPGPPDWLPQAPSGDFATTALLFKTAQYASGGVAVSVGSLLGDSDVGVFKPSEITGAGMACTVDNENQPATIGGLLTDLLQTNYTGYVEFNPDPTTREQAFSGHEICLVADATLPNASDALEVGFLAFGSPTTAGVYCSAFNGSYTPIGYANAGLLNKLAWTYDTLGGTISASLNGLPLNTDNVLPADLTRGLLGCTDIGLSFSLEGTVQQFDVYPKQDSADLVAWTAVDPFISTPIIYRPFYGAEYDQTADADFMVCPFSSNTDTHASTSWEVRTAPAGGGTAVFSSLNDAVHLTSIVVPAATLSAATQYYFRCLFHGDDISSAWDEMIIDTTGFAGIIVHNITELNAALAASTPGDNILCTVGDYDGVSANGTAFGGVTVGSYDPTNPATLKPFYLQDTSGLTFTNLLFDVTGSADPFPNRVVRCDTVAFTHCGFHGDLAGDPHDQQTGLLVGSIGNGNTNVTVQYCEFHKLVKGVVLGANDNVNILNNHIHDIGIDGIESDDCSNVTIADNWITDLYPQDGDHPDAIQFFTPGAPDPIVNVSVLRNLYDRGSGASAQGILVGDEGGVTYTNLAVSENVIVGALFNGIAFGAGYTVDVDANQILQWSDQQSWLVLRGDMTDVTITDNVASQFSYLDGIVPIVDTGNTTTGSQPVDQGAAAIATWQAAHPVTYGPTA